MSTERTLLCLSFLAAEDLSDDQFRFVVLTSAGTVRRPNSELEPALGILQNTPESGAAASVCLVGKSKFVSNGAIAIGKYISPEYVSAADAGKGQDAGANMVMAKGLVLEAPDAEDSLGSCLVLPFSPTVVGLNGQVPVTQGLVSVIATAGAATYTAAQLLGGLILRDPAGGARSDVSPTAALIIAAIAQGAAGNQFRFTIRNTADAAETITLTAGTDATLSGTMTIAQNNSKEFLCVVTAATTVTIYSLGTIVF